MAIGVSISLVLIVVLLVAYMAFNQAKPITRQNLPGGIVLIAVAATALPWTKVLPPGFWSMPGGILINGLILGTLIGGGIKFGPGKTL